MKLNDEAYTIVGVMPATASVTSWTAMACDIWVPLALSDEQRAARGNPPVGITIGTASRV